MGPLGRFLSRQYSNWIPILYIPTEIVTCRTVPGSDRLVGNLARMLPAHYDLDDPSVVRESARRLLAGQAATLGDLALDPGQPMPIVFHVVREDAALPPSFMIRPAICWSEMALMPHRRCGSS